MKNRNKYFLKPLTEAEESIHDFLLNNNKKIFSLSINKIASKANVSAPTVSRFIRKSGFSSLLEFRNYFFNLNTNKIKGNKIITREDSDMAINQLKIENDFFIDFITQPGNVSILNNIKNSINISNKKIIIGHGTSQIPAIALNNDLINLNENSEFITNNDLLFQKLNFLDKNDLLIIFSVSAKSKHIELLLEILRGAKVKVILVTSNTSYIENVQKIFLPRISSYESSKLADNQIQLSFVKLLSTLL